VCIRVRQWRETTLRDFRFSQRYCSKFNSLVLWRRVDWSVVNKERKASFTRRFVNAIPVAEWRVRYWSCIKTNVSVHAAIRAGFRMRFSICESPELRPPSYFLDKIRCQLSRRGRGIASFTRRILSLHSSTYNLCAAVVLSWFCCVLKLLRHFDLLYRTFNTVQQCFKWCCRHSIVIKKIYLGLILFPQTTHEMRFFPGVHY